MGMTSRGADDEAKPAVVLVKPHQICVTFLPYPGVDVSSESFHRLTHLGDRQPSDAGDACADFGIEVRGRSAPPRVAEAVDAVVRDRHHFDRSTAQRSGDVTRGRVERVKLGHRREVLRDEPLMVVHVVIEREHDDWPLRYPPQLGETLMRVAPVVHSEHGHCCVERRVVEGEMLGKRPHHASYVARPLPDHGEGRLDSHHATIDRLVRAVAGAHVDHGGRIA